MTRKAEMTGIKTGMNYILATCHACSIKILLDSCRVFLEFAKIEEKKGRLLTGWG